MKNSLAFKQGLHLLSRALTGALAATLPLAVVTVIGGTSLLAQAQSWNRDELNTPKNNPADLMSETQSLKIGDERTIQRKDAPPHLFVGVEAGLVNLGNFDVQGSGAITHYNMDHFVPSLGINIQSFPSRWDGRWGWAGSAGYSYAEFNAANPIAMHVMPLTIAAAYRYKIRDRQLFTPYGQLGPAAWVYIQRGLDQDNTSGVSWGAIATAGISVNMNEAGLFEGRNSLELNLQYSRSFLGVSATNFMGDTIAAGATMIF